MDCESEFLDIQHYHQICRELVPLGLFASLPSHENEGSAARMCITIHSDWITLLTRRVDEFGKASKHEDCCSIGDMGFSPLMTLFSVSILSSSQQLHHGSFPIGTVHKTATLPSPHDGTSTVVASSKVQYDTVGTNWRWQRGGKNEWGRWLRESAWGVLGMYYCLELTSP